MRSNHRENLRSRKGAAAVEFAVVVPVIVFIVLGSIEASSIIFLRQTLVQAAYEGAKVAIKSDASTATAETAIQSVLNGRGLEDVSITFDPANISTANPGGLL